MKYIKYILIFCFPVLIGVPSTAQNVLDGVYDKHHNKSRKVIPYAHLREADVMFLRRIWREIDFNEKANMVFLWPKSMFVEILTNAIEAGELTAYAGEQFKELKPWETISDEITKRETIWVPDPITGEEKQQVVENTLDWERDVRMLRVKEAWFFDKQRSVMEPRIIGIAPLYTRYDDAEMELAKLPLCWIYYPELRYVIANTEVYNRANDAKRMSYLDVFDKRMFSSYIIQENNVYDRKIIDYKQGKDAILEANRIKDELILYEHDLWHY
ncbi:gliding motility protein GldN [Candidatus Amoebophilus asiaticus]|nr:gliding motility protein GldN [Candidatus Amoebophilus asiaticus]